MKLLPIGLAIRIPIEDTYGNEPDKYYVFSISELEELYNQDKITIGAEEHAYFEGKKVILVMKIEKKGKECE